MIEVGDLVKSKLSGKVGIVTGVARGSRADLGYEFCYVLMPNNTYTIHKQNLEPLETK